MHSSHDVLDPHRVIKETFGFDTFRPHQESIVSAILDSRDVFAALPTGGGKSLCYQLPALVLAGHWYGGEGVLVLFAITLTLVLLVIGMFDGERPVGPRDGLTGLPTRQALVEAIDTTFASATQLCVAVLQVDAPAAGSGFALVRDAVSIAVAARAAATGGHGDVAVTVHVIFRKINCRVCRDNCFYD